MKALLNVFFSLILATTTVAQPSFDYYKNPDKVGSANAEAFEFFKTAYYDHVFSWTREGADSAIFYLNKAISLDPEYGAAYALLGHIHQYLTYGNNYTKAKVKSQEEYAYLAKKFAPELGDTYTLLADVLWEKGQRDSSIVLLEKAVEMEPDHAGNHIWLGIRYASGLTDGKVREAQQEFDYILNEIDSAYGQAYMKMGALFEYQIKDLDSAELYYKLAEQLYSTMPVKDDRMLISKFSLAAIAFDKGNINKAIDYYLQFEKAIVNKDLFFDFHLKDVYRSLMRIDSANHLAYKNKYVDYVESQSVKTNDENFFYAWDYMNLGDKELIDEKVWPIATDLIKPLTIDSTLSEEDFVGPLFIPVNASKITSDYQKGIDVLLSHQILDRYKPYKYYFLAKLFALDKQGNKAIEYLTISKQLGFPWFESVKDDKDFEGINEEEDFLRLIR